MIITKARIENFKSIESLEIPFDKVGDSYTKIFVGVNESGKSNILEALSCYYVSKEQVSYEHFCNQKLIEDGKTCNVYFHLSLDNNEEKHLNDYILSMIDTVCDIDLKLSSFVKDVYLLNVSSQFNSIYLYKVSFNNDLYINPTNQKGKIV